MTVTARSFWKVLSRGLAWAFFGVAVVAFWVGGRVISEIGHMDRILAEMFGLAIAGATGALGYIFKTKADDLAVQDSPDQ